MSVLEQQCTLLAELQTRRRFCIKAVVKQTNAAGGLVRRALGITKDAPEAERAKANLRAARIYRAAVFGSPVIQDADAAVFAMVEQDMRLVAAGIAPYEEARASFELEMRRVARKLPVGPWMAEVRGLGELALGVIVGEAGDLACYSTVEKLWKRLGLAPYGGLAASTWRSPIWRGGEPALTADDWKAIGYAPQRRAEIYSCVGDPLFRAQTAAKDGSRPSGPYRIAYDVRRVRTAETHPDWSKAHSHNDALRIMTKTLIFDLWSEWRRASGVSPNGAMKRVPAAEPLQEAA